MAESSRTTTHMHAARLLAALLACALALSGASLLTTEPANAMQGNLTAQEPQALDAQGLQTQQPDVQASVESQATASKLKLKSGHTYVLYSGVGSAKALYVKKASKANNANAVIWSFTHSSAQQWVVKVNSKGYATLKALSSGKYLTVNGKSVKNGSNVVQRAYSGSKAQSWRITRNANGTYQLSSALNPKVSLDVNGAKTGNGTNVQVWASNKTKAQQWRFFDVTAMKANLAALAKKNKGSVKAGTYVIYPKVGSSKVLDIYGGNSANGANLQLYAYNGSSAQLFKVSYDQKGYASIANASGKYLGVSGGKAKSGASVKQYTRSNSLAQKWIITKNANGTFRVKSALWNDLCLDVEGAGTTNYTDVQVYTANSTRAQQWTFVKPSKAAKDEAKKAAKQAPTSKKGIGTLKGTTKASYNGISLSGAKAAGIDVSVWNGTINWNKVAASGVRFAIIRCGYGSDYASQDDTTFLANVRGARAAGLDIGVYLYSYATTPTGGDASAKSEAEHTLRLLREAGLTPSKLKYGVYYDIEDPSQEGCDFEALCTTYCNTIKAAGYKVGVYSSLSWWNNILTSSTYNKWNRWVAQWPYKTGGQKCAYTGKYKIWQCMSDGQVPGIVGRVDMNLAY